jgi:protein-export membrane protein SecD/preprotein translocase SecF subunit
MKQLRWRLIIIAVITLWAAYSVAPSVIYFAAPKEIRNSPEELSKRIPSWLPQKHVSLGLDLQGGVQLVLGVNTDNAVDNKLGRLGTEVQRWSDDKGIGVAKAYVLAGKQTLRLEVKDGVDLSDVLTKFKAEYPGLEQVARADKSLDLKFDDAQIKHIKASAIEQAEKVVRNRIDKWGVSEPVINRRQADNSILVQLPGFKDPGKAKELLGRTAQLKFKLVDDKFEGFVSLTDLPAEVTRTNNGGQTALTSENRDVLTNYIKGKVPEDRLVYMQREDLAGGKKARYTTYVVEAATEIGGDDILDAFVTQDTSGFDQRPEVSMRFTGPGGKRFGDLTGANIGRRLAIVLDDELVSAPVIQSKIATGQGRITLGNRGGFEQLFQEAQQLALILKSGALPATIQVLEERQVGATLGPELADEGIRGVLLGLAAVLVYMMVYYRRPGFLADVSLLLNGLYLLAMMGLLGSSLSLPGIAGFILTLGMAVDSNVLINERIRQELSEGKSAKKAVDNGFNRVLWTVLDTHATSLISALVLLETNSSGPVRGFAVTLIMGLLASIFTSMYCTRSFFEFVLSKAKNEKETRNWLGGENADKHHVFKFKFLRYSKPYAGAMVALIIGILAVTYGKGVNWGVDFAGGTELQVRFASEVEPSSLEEAARSVGVKSVGLQTVGEGRKQYLIRFGAEDVDLKSGEELTPERQSQLIQDLKTAVTTKLTDKGPEILSADYVGPQVGKELRNQGVLSMLYAIIAILAYIGLRFDLRFAPGAVLKMICDLMASVGFYVFAGRSVDLTAIACFLTIIGYSVNDAVVIFDRIREHIQMGTGAKRSMYDLIDLALNETLIRSINTSCVVLISLLGILVFASGSIWNFGASMAVGVIAATASSTFLASASVIWFEGLTKPKNRGTAQPSPKVSPARS